MEDYRLINRDYWDERAPAHAQSADYGLDRFVEPDYLSQIVRFDLPLLGDIKGARGVHLQCHIGTDTVSLARLGAEMTGLDFSLASVEVARGLSDACGAGVTFVTADVYDAAQVLAPASFDLVFTGVGALCWLPDIRRWAGVVASLLAPGGRLFLRESHPVMWALQDDRPDDLLVINYPYFEVAEATTWEEGGSYVRTEKEFDHRLSMNFNHGLGEIVSALIDEGLMITGLVEHRSLYCEALPGLMDRIGGGEWRLRNRPERLPHSYTLQAVKPQLPTS